MLFERRREFYDLYQMMAMAMKCLSISVISSLIYILIDVSVYFARVIKHLRGLSWTHSVASVMGECRPIINLSFTHMY